MLSSGEFMGHKYLSTSLSFPKHCQCNSFLACLNTQIKPVLTTAETEKRQIDMVRDREVAARGRKNHVESRRKCHMFASTLKRAFKFKYHICRSNELLSTCLFTGIFRVQCKVSSTDSTCGIMLTTTN